MKRMWWFMILAALGLGLTACKKAEPVEEEEVPREYEVRGVIRKLDLQRRSIVVKHEEIPGFMTAMTMPFDVRDTNELTKVKPGDRILFRLLVTTNDGWIDRIRVLGADTNAAATPEPQPVRFTKNVPVLAPGDTLPDYVLTNELGKTIRLSDFRGQVLAFSFIFTRCPYPDFCPRISDNLSRASKRLASMPDAPKNVHLLSISFDPEHDTPAMLLAYAERYAYDPKKWSLASGGWDQLEPLTGHFGLIYSRDVPPDKVEHNLRTVVVTPSGKVHAILNSNEWEVDELVSQIVEAAKKP
jgi:protein SCO1/2